MKILCSNFKRSPGFIHLYLLVASSESSKTGTNFVMFLIHFLLYCLDMSDLTFVI